MDKETIKNAINEAEQDRVEVHEQLLEFYNTQCVDKERNPWSVAAAFLEVFATIGCTNIGNNITVGMMLEAAQAIVMPSEQEATAGTVHNAPDSLN